MPPDYDVIIIGGGMVGASLACALASQPLRIGIVEAVPFQDDRQPSFDDRGLALAVSSQRVLAGLALWNRIGEEANPIRHVHVSDRGHFGFVRMDAETVGMDALGYVVLARVLGKVLTENLIACENIELFCPARLHAIHHREERVEVSVQLNGDRVRLYTRLVVGADGTNSQVRQALGTQIRERDYGQTAIVANVVLERSDRDTAYERFTKTGPLALLPLLDGRSALVWTVATGEAERILVLDEQSCLKNLEESFGGRLGRFLRIGQRKSYPLCMIEAKQQAGSRIVVLGNAAHTVHPNAAQGFNLGLRDVAALAEVISDAVRAGEDHGSEQCLNQYVASRKSDQHRIIAFTDGLASFFYNDHLSRILVRDMGMLAVDLVPPLKRQFMRHAMGLFGPQPRLVRGLPL